jgi:hypothetical protein
MCRADLMACRDGRAATDSPGTRVTHSRPAPDTSRISTASVGGATWSVTSGAPLVVGPRVLTATQADTNGDASVASASMISSSPPPRVPEQAGRDGRSDSGNPGDGITDLTA